MTKNLCFVKCGFFFYIKELSIKQTSKRRRRRSRDTKENGRRMDGIQISEITKRTGRHFKKKVSYFCAYHVGDLLSLLTVYNLSRNPFSDQRKCLYLFDIKYLWLDALLLHISTQPPPGCRCMECVSSFLNETL